MARVFAPRSWCRAGGDIQLRKLSALVLLMLTPIGKLLATCTATAQGAGDEPVVTGSPASATATGILAGDLVAITAWCFPGCTPGSVTLGSQKAVQTSVSGVPGPGTTSVVGEGQPFLFYILSAAASGSQTLIFTASNFTTPPSGYFDQTQVSYQIFRPSAGCRFSHEVDSPLGSGTAPTANTPSITPTAVGELLFVFTATSEHINSVNSPWSCTVIPSSGVCGVLQNTRNGVGYILSGASGSAANNMTQLHSSDTYQALITSFSIASGGAQAPKPPTNLQATVQ
jgi:hypothetical protein